VSSITDTPPADPPDRATLLAALDRELRTGSAQSVLFSQAVADALGMNPTDLECLDLLSVHGAITPKRLAELTGLTTGAITGVLDRLERAGHVRRRPNPRDRRSLIIELDAEHAAREIGPLYAALGQSMADLHAGYSDAELALLLHFTARGNAIMRDEIARLRGEKGQAR
jgi:DNA-binding MarR family transcriptional regulator